MDFRSHPAPGITNAILCGLIFKMGEYAVVKDVVYCVDFSESVPNCIALYMLLVMQKVSPDARVQLIDAGDGTDKRPLMSAMDALQVCGSDWHYTVL